MLMSKNVNNDVSKDSPIASLKFIVGVQVAKCYLRGFSLELVYFGKKTVVTEAWKYCFEKLIANGLQNKDLILLD